MPYIQGKNRDQLVLVSSTLDDCIKKDNPIRFIDAFVDKIDLKKLGFKHAEEYYGVGRYPYNPKDLLKLSIYGYGNNIRSSRKLETETHRNIEVMFLINGLKPDHKTISDFRKDNKHQMKGVFREFTVICKKLELFGNEQIAIDGSKFKAVNAKKKAFTKNYVLKKIKTLDDYRKKYKDIVKEIETSGESQITFTDPESRLMKTSKGTDVCYNVQISIDKKHKLMVDYEATNDINDLNQLNNMANKSKEILEVDELEVLADKGYCNPKEIKKCVDNGIIPYVPKPKANTTKTKGEFCKSKFKYDKEKDVYICPNNCELKFFKKHKKESENIYKLYKSNECKNCALKKDCTKSKTGRVIERWEHEEIMEEMEKRVKANKDKIKTRQHIVEHPFGTIKRAFNQGYMILKGLIKVNAEFALTAFNYNLKRVINIVGTEKLILALG